MKRIKKELFYGMMYDAGFKSLREFSKACGIEAGNICNNLNGRYDISIERMFVLAKTLRVPIDAILEVFYSEELEANKEYQL